MTVMDDTVALYLGGLREDVDEVVDRWFGDLVSIRSWQVREWPDGRVEVLANLALRDLLKDRKVFVASWDGLKAVLKDMNVKLEVRAVWK